MAELQVEDKKRVDEIRIAQIEAEVEEKNRADELQAEKDKRADEILIALPTLTLSNLDEIQIAPEAAEEQTKIEADKERALKELELRDQQNQVSGNLAATPPPRN